MVSSQAERRNGSSQRGTRGNRAHTRCCTGISQNTKISMHLRHRIVPDLCVPCGNAAIPACQERVHGALISTPFRDNNFASSSILVENRSRPIIGRTFPNATRQGRPRTSREVALAQTRVHPRRPRVFRRTFDAVPHRTHVRSISDRPACAVCVACVVSEPRASSDEHRIVITSPGLRRFPTFLAIPLSPRRTESETVLGLSWVAVVGVLRGVGRLEV
jgi:hypothetical protein